MTATPHNGKPEDFHLFLALLDIDSFERRKGPVGFALTILPRLGTGHYREWARK